MDFSLFFPIHLHAFHMAFFLLYFLHDLHLLLHTFHITFTLVRCMIQSRPIAGSTRSPNPLPTTSDLIADRLRFQFASRIQFRLACRPISNFSCQPISNLLTNQFLVCLQVGFQFACQFRFQFTCRFQFRFHSHYQPIQFYCQPVLGT